MTERPILFSAPMVRAILAGTKTQTRRVVRKQFVADAIPAEVAATTPEGWQVSGHSGLWWDDAGACIDDAVRCPHGMPGDQLWVRQAYRLCAEADSAKPRDTDPAYRVWFEADAPHQPGFGKLRPGMFMPRWASRITLEVTGVRVERLQDISEADAIAEGAEPYRLPCHPAREALRHVDGFRALWESINGPGSWDANPWVWVISFKRLETNR